MTDLSKKQIVFTKYLAHLLIKFYEDGICLGEAWRSEETCALYAKEGKGIKNSAHLNRLAIDLLLKKDGQISTDKNDYLPLGIYWKKLPIIFPASISIETVWGGDFQTLNDPFHFSIEHNGIR